MRFTLSNLIAPHYCCSCGEIGSILCSYCKYNIVSEVPAVCFQCMKPVGTYGDICGECKTYYTKGWFAGYHRTAVRELIQELKFNSNKSAGLEAALLLAESLPCLPAEVIVTNTPTVPSHTRQRGFDHTKNIAVNLARISKVKFCPALGRNHNLSQRGANRATRLAQAKNAYVATDVQKDGRYLLIDDVSTTGATLNYAAKALVEAGAKEVWVAVVSREPLD